MNKEDLIKESEKEIKKILESNHYAMAKVLVACDDNLEPVVEAEMHNCSSFEIAKLILCMESIIKQLEAQSPMIPIIKNSLGHKSETIIVEG